MFTVLTGLRLQELGQIRERLQTKRSRLFGLLTHTFEVSMRPIGHRAID
jgi:hypothetical protein